MTWIAAGEACPMAAGHLQPARGASKIPRAYSTRGLGMKILTVVATGKYAGLVVPELKRRGATVRALIRSEDDAPLARKRGLTRQPLAT